MLRHGKSLHSFTPKHEGSVCNGAGLWAHAQEEIPIRFAERIRWIEQVGQVIRYHQISLISSHVLLCLFLEKGEQYKTC